MFIHQSYIIYGTAQRIKKSQQASPIAISRDCVVNKNRYILQVVRLGCIMNICD